MPSSFLFLQGPLGPFFRLLGRRLRQAGHKVVRINFNGGDVLDWPTGPRYWFTETPDRWPDYVLRLAAEHEITDLVLFGDCRAFHRAAIEALKGWRPDLRVHVFEEGYLRPDWITLEPGGVNGFSSLPRCASDIRTAPERFAGNVLGETVGPAARTLGLRATIAYFAMFCMGLVFRHYVHHRPMGPLAEMRAWIGRLAGYRRRRRIATAKQDALAHVTGRIFTLILQLDSDKQITHHSPFKNMHEFMSFVISSFSRKSLDSDLLVVKNHPLDNWVINHERNMQILSASHGVEDRCVFIDGGDLINILEKSTGAITINSTAGFSALHRLIPLAALGNAIYDIEGLTHQAGLDDFWQAPEQPDHALYSAFRRLVGHRTQINGGFYTSRGIALALDEALSRLAPDEPRPLPMQDVAGANES